MWNDFWFSVLASAGLAGLLTLLLNLLLGYWLNDKIKKLEAEQARNNFKLTAVFGKTEQVIVSVHGELLKIKEHVEKHITFFDPAGLIINVPEWEKIQESIKAFEQTFKKDRLYLTQDTAQIIDDYIKLLNEILHALFSIAHAKNKTHVSDSEISKSIKHSSQRRNEAKLSLLRNLTEKMFINIEDDFRFVLGFPKPKKKFNGRKNSELEKILRKL